MKVTFTDGRVFSLPRVDKAGFLNVEAMAIEMVTGLDFGEYEAKLKNKSMLAFTAFVWVMAKRQEPTLRFDDVQFDFGLLEDEPGDLDEDDDEDQVPKGSAPADESTSATAS